MRQPMQKAEKGLWIIILEITIFISIVVADALGIVPITQTIFLVPLIFLSLRWQHQSLRTIGFRKSNNTGRLILFGILLGIAIELFATYITTPVINSMFGTEPDYTELSAIKGNLVMLLIYILISWVLGGLGEEIAFRGFLMKRLSKIFTNFHPNFMAIILSSLLFGFGHTEQGPAGWVQEGLNSVYLGIIMVGFGNRLIVPIIAHGVSNMVALTLIYLGAYPGIY